MSVLAVGRSSLLTSLKRYSRSFGLWLLLLTGPVGARFMIARDDGSGIQIAVGHHLPVMTSAMLGVSLGIVVSTLLLPIGFLYLRSNVTRRQPWQVEEVTAARRVAITLGRFGADVTVLFGMLTTLTLAGWLLGWLIVSGPLNVVQVTGCLWLVAAPALMGLAAVHQLLGALPWTRRALGDVAFFTLWMTSIVLPSAVDNERSSLWSNMYDFPGFVRPIVGASPSQGKNFEIGGGSGLLPGRIPLDVLHGIYSEGYIPSRLAWAAIAIALAAIAGVLHRPHLAPKRRRTSGILTKLLAPRSAPPASANTPPAPSVARPFANLIIAEFRLIGHGRLFVILATLVAIAGTFGDYRHVGSPAALLLLIFALASHAGRSEAAGLLALTRTTEMQPAARRLAFLIAGLAWGAVLALPAALIRLSPQPFTLALAATGTATLIAMALSTVSRSSFASRLTLLVLWYGYLSS